MANTPRAQRYRGRKRRAASLRRAETAAQLHRRLEGEYWAAKSDEWAASPLGAACPRKRRSAAARLRELELHPDRLERLLAKP